MDKKLSLLDMLDNEDPGEDVLAMMGVSVSEAEEFLALLTTTFIVQSLETGDSVTTHKAAMMSCVEAGWRWAKHQEQIDA